MTKDKFIYRIEDYYERKYSPTALLYVNAWLLKVPEHFFPYVLSSTTDLYSRRFRIPPGIHELNIALKVAKERYWREISASHQLPMSETVITDEERKIVLDLFKAIRKELK